MKRRVGRGSPGPHIMAEGLLFKTCRGPVTVLARETQEIMFMKRFLEPVFEASITCGLVGVLIHYETAGVYMRTKQLGYIITTTVNKLPLS